MAKSMKEYGYSMCAMSTSVLDLLRALKKRDGLTFREILEESLELYLEKHPDARKPVAKSKTFSERALGNMNSTQVTLDLG